jgi:hypothetical protein
LQGVEQPDYKDMIADQSALNIILRQDGYRDKALIATHHDGFVAEFMHLHYSWENGERRFAPVLENSVDCGVRPSCPLDEYNYYQNGIIYPGGSTTPFAIFHQYCVDGNWWVDIKQKYEEKYMDNPEIVRWEDGGVQCWGVTAAYKQLMIIDYGLRLGLKNFVETGTWHGDTLAAVRGRFDQLYSVELSPELYKQNTARFAGCQDVHLFCGDSGAVINEILGQLDGKPTLFWLDAHPSGGDTVGDESPLQRELDAILSSVNTGVILIDDLQDCWQHNWAQIAVETVAKYGAWRQEIKYGIMRVIHRGTLAQ